MPLPHLHILHPPALRFPHLLVWLADVENVLRTDANWDGCELHRTECTLEARFNVPTLCESVSRALGPVVVIQKVQAGLLDQFKKKMCRRASVYAISPQGPEDIWQACEVARMGFEDGEPRISQREVIAYLIVRKLERQKMWGGVALNKNFLWQDDLPKGGFPKDLCDAREILEVADVLATADILSRKTSQGEMKYALGTHEVVWQILSAKAFEGHLKLQNYFNKSRKYVPSSLLDYEE
jgi:hypothetical protein